MSVVAGATTAARPFAVRALGEIAIRCRDLEAMVSFYRDVIGLPVLEGSRQSGIVFLSIGESYGGHTAVLALFRPDAGRADLHPLSNAPPETGARSSLHHLALTVAADDQQAIVDWYRTHGLTFRVEHFDWIGWRGIFTTDPDGNTVELVAKVGGATPALT